MQPIHIVLLIMPTYTMYSQTNKTCHFNIAMRYRETVDNMVNELACFSVSDHIHRMYPSL